jgi:hypothetical protein
MANILSERIGIHKHMMQITSGWNQLDVEATGWYVPGYKGYGVEPDQADRVDLEAVYVAGQADREGRQQDILPFLAKHHLDKIEAELLAEGRAQAAGPERED